MYKKSLLCPKFNTIYLAMGYFLGEGPVIKPVLILDFLRESFQANIMELVTKFMKFSSKVVHNLSDYFLSI
jgi:hypothetical protein